MAARVTALADLRRAARGVGTALALSVVAVAPGRWQLAGLEARGRLEQLGSFFAGLLLDTSVLAVPAALMAAAALLVGRRWLARLLLAGFSLLLWVVVVSVCESRLSRGVFPSWVDVHLMLESPPLMRGSLDMFFAERNLAPVVLLVPVVAALLASWPRATAVRRWRPAAYGLALGIVSWLGLGSVAAIAHGPRVEQSTPLGLATLAELPEAAACFIGSCEPGALAEPFEESADPTYVGAIEAEGAAMLGWPPPARERCDGRAVERSWPSVELAGPRRARAAVLLERLGALSDVLFGHSDEPLHLWHVVLEGVRGDDLHGLNRAAPAEVAPWLAALYEKASAGQDGVLAARHMWTAGVRTPHGIGALCCGLGTLPYGLTLSRDLPALPLRCLPDLLREAGFDVGYGYGGSPELDRVGPFLEAHGLAPWITRATLGADAATTAWGATDRALFGASAEAARQGASSYALLLTLSHHHPFVAPRDLRADVRARAEQAFALADRRARSVDRDRLVTLAYTDDALREWFEALGRRALLDRGIIVISADHAVPDRPLWQDRPGAAAAHRVRAVVPFVLWIAPRLLAHARDPELARSILEGAAHELARAPLSQNDVPTLLLALLERAPLVRDLPAASRWHSMGGQASSPFYLAAGPRDTAIHGIHAGTALYFVDERGSPTAPDEPAPLVVTRERAGRVTPSLQPAGRTLARVRAESPACPSAAGQPSAR